MKLRVSFTAVLIMVMAAGLYADNLELTVGTGYEYISTDYYLLSEDTLIIDPDSLESLKLTSDASNEFSILGKLRYKTKLSDLFDLNIYNRTSLSTESFRNNLDIRLQAGAFRLYNYLNLRNLDSGDDQSGLNRDYINNSTSLIFNPDLGRGFELEMKNAFEFTRYDQPSGYYYDYNYNKFNLELTKNFGFEGRLTAGYRNDTKRVSDSSRLEFDRHVFRFSAEYSPGYKFRLYIDNEYALKDSKKDGGLEDHSLENLILSAFYRPSALLSFKLYSELEYSDYDVEDFVYYDLLYMRNDFEFCVTVNESLELKMIPHYRFYSAGNAEFDDQDYDEYSIEPGFEYNLGFELWLDASFEIGKRKYPGQESGILTDHNLYILDLLLDASISDNLRFNLLGSIDWERHQEKTDNTTLYLISTSLEYTF